MIVFKNILFVFLSMGLILSCQAETLSIRADYWYPMNGEPNNDKPGYMIELATKIFNKKGIDIDYQLMPWNRAVKQTRKGDFDCVVGTYKEDTPDFVFPKNNWGWDKPQLYIHKNDNWTFNNNYKSLLNRRVGLITGYAYQHNFDEFALHNKGIHFQYISGDHALEVNINKILAERIDTLIESESVLQATLAKMNLAHELKAVGSITAPIKMYMACSPNKPSSQKYVDIIDAAMPALIKSGELTKIMKKYGLQSW